MAPLHVSACITLLFYVNLFASIAGKPNMFELISFKKPDDSSKLEVISGSPHTSSGNV